MILHDIQLMTIILSLSLMVDLRNKNETCSKSNKSKDVRFDVSKISINDPQVFVVSKILQKDQFIFEEYSISV